MSKLIQRGNIGVQKAEKSFIDKASEFIEKVLKSPLTRLAVLFGGAYAISNNIMKNGYDATADIPHMNFSLTKK